MNTIEDALSALKQGKMVVVVDDEHRENEGDLIASAYHITPDQVNFMITKARGLVCLALPPARLKAIGIDLLKGDLHEKDAYKTAFTHSIDAKQGISTGISAYDRAYTIQTAMKEGVTPHDFVVPGHIFPLKAKEKGVLERRGHTEAAVDLTRLAGIEPGGVICEILNEDGTMMRLPHLLSFAKKHDLPLISIQDLVQFRLEIEKMFPEITLPTRWGDFNLMIYPEGEKEHTVLWRGNKGRMKNPLVRIHSECLTGDVFGSKKCDCGDQLEDSFQKIAQEEEGMIIYLRQEGRGIGLTKKIQAYALQEKGLDTVEANHALGLQADERLYDSALHILRTFSIESLRLLTNNPDKLKAVSQSGITCHRIPLVTAVRKENDRYQKTKTEKLGHLYHAC